MLSTWPERDGVEMVDNPLGGRREAKGLWAWKLETMEPGTSTTVSFAVNGLSKGVWSEIDIFFRGAGDIMFASKLDDEILAEMLREEEAGVEHEDEDDGDSPEVVIDSAAVEESPTVIVNEENEEDAEPEQGWFGVGRGEEE